MPKFGETAPEKPFSRVLTEFMWQQRPPWTTGKLARRLGLSRQTVANWLYHNVTPSVEVMFSIMKDLNIPLERLIEAYEQAGVPIPPRETPPAPESKPYTPPEPPEPTPDEWQVMTDHTRAVLASIGMDPEAIDTIIRHVQQTRSATSQMERHIIAEHLGSYAEDNKQAQPYSSDHHGRSGRTQEERRQSRT